ncbi:ATP-dependent DNA helicase RecQ [uncultured Azohydromonas sp.]|uniref:RecQ family ATP-dependent DNA helicase n=1 Tax=uncultured Azohydromonas sp. TaxID=487342 RepID=UPI00261AD229|nr:ATP-dependent DNA helicase RecQ [uncultured Azohydromonas sp.]
MTANNLPAALRRSLRRTFGLRELREGQQAVIERVLAGQDTLAVMPTGAGKSLCYQLPALHLDGRTVVVSPLIALMHDQASKLEEAGVEAAQLNSARPASEQKDSMARIAEARSDIVFTTPERLEDVDFVETLRQAGVALLVVDEAHCISQWGHDFRPAFLGIGTALRALGNPPVLALTATATDQVITDIRRHLGRPELQVVDTGVYRPNLRLQVAVCDSEKHKFETLQRALAKTTGPGIVYAATVKACEELYQRLGAAGESVTRYHGKLRAVERHANQERFMSGQARVMVATNAFGMGIDKADLRFVLHYQLPGSLLTYYQEAGRAGRDGEAADCALLYHRPDRQVQQFFLARSRPDRDELRAVLDALSQAPMSAAALLQRLRGFTRHRLMHVLTLLRDAGVVRANRTRAWSLLPGAESLDLAPLVADYDARAEHEHEALERMVFYAQTGLCRWRVLLEYFEQEPPFEGEHCGHCDNCLNFAAAQEAAQAEALRPAVAATPAAANEAIPAAALQEQPSPQAVTPGPGLALPEPPAPATPPPSLRKPAKPPSLSTPAPFQVGEAVRVPRYGSGRVASASAEEVAIQFPDGRTRRFVAQYVQREEEAATVPVQGAAAA